MSRFSVFKIWKSHLDSVNLSSSRCLPRTLLVVTNFMTRVALQSSVPVDVAVHDCSRRFIVRGTHKASSVYGVSIYSRTDAQNEIMLITKRVRRNKIEPPSKRWNNVIQTDPHFDALTVWIALLEPVRVLGLQLWGTADELNTKTFRNILPRRHFNARMKYTCHP